jgi:hypothetical protein
VKVFVTKYALSKGIYVDDIEPSGVCESMVSSKTCSLHYHGKGKDWHTDRDSALRRAEVMRARKIRSLEDSIARLKGLRFDC